MIHLNKLRILSTLKWVSSNSVDCYRIPFSPAGSVFYTPNNPRFYGTKKIVDSQFSNSTRKEAQYALLEYLHSTRSLQFSDAELMSKNSPIFLEKLLKKVDSKEDVGWSVTRFLRYHPINEFEPFFESVGLRPSQYRPFLPRDLMFLSDDELLLENFHTLCDYGIPMNKIGRIYKEARDVFRYDYGVLQMRLQAYEGLGLDQSLVGKIVVCSPYLLIGDVNVELIEVMEILRKGGIELCWFEKHLVENCSYNWSQLLALLNLFSNSGYREEQLGAIIRQHPGILFEGSGVSTFSLIGFLVKFGCSINQICSMFLQFPEIQVGKFLLNIRRCFLFLTEIDMQILDIGNIIRSHPLMLGSCTLKKFNRLRSCLKVGKKRICNIILQNPEEMKNWAMGCNISRLPSEKPISWMLKNKFLLDLGFVENSPELEKKLKAFRCSGTELQERFDCIMQAGLDKEDVCKIIRHSPDILNQSKENIKMKINFLVNELGYPLSSLLTFPAFLKYSIRTVKFRFSMYNWLKDQGTVTPMLSLSTLVAISDKLFVRRYVELHPDGSKSWQNLKNNYNFE